MTILYIVRYVEWPASALNGQTQRALYFVQDFLHLSEVTNDQSILAAVREKYKEEIKEYNRLKSGGNGLFFLIYLKLTIRI